MGKFRTAQGAQSIACAHKANAGHLFCLEKSFVFIHKPTVIVKHEDIETVEFERAGQGAATRNFDLRLQLKGGGSRVQDATFTGIARDGGAADDDGADADGWEDEDDDDDEDEEDDDLAPPASAADVPDDDDEFGHFS